MYELYGQGLIAALKIMFLKGAVSQIDETKVQVLKEHGRANTALSYMFAMYGGEREKPIIIYTYNETRSPEFLLDYLKGYKGTVLTDGFKAYDNVIANLCLPHANCNLHARRNFYNAAKIAKESKATEALDIYRQLYAIENEAKVNKLSPVEIRELRQKKSKPIMQKFKEWLEELNGKILPSSPLGKAVAYCIKRWNKLTLFLEDGHIQIDTNIIENGIRPFVIGRRNWLFAGSPRGAEASALYYSLIETMKANEIEPYWGLRYLFTNLPYAKTIEDYIAILPMNVPEEKIEAFKAEVRNSFK
jgi:transposase